MKAISLWQPWASLMQVKAKHYETRGRLTHFRGELAICAAKRIVTDLGELQRYYAAMVRMGQISRLHYLPTGCVVAVVEVIDCVSTDKIAGPNIGKHNLDDLEYACGNYQPGRFAWITTNCRPLKQPVPVVGHQGFFNLPTEVEAKVMDQI